MTMIQPEPGPIALADLTDEAERRAEIRAEQAAKRAREQEHQNLRHDRQAAVNHVKDTLGVSTLPNAWERLEADPHHRSRAVVHPFTDRDDLLLAFRPRAVTQGGNVLTVLALARDDETWVGSADVLEELADLPAVIDDAQERAEAWPISEEEAEQYLAEEGAGPVDDPEPRFRVEADTLAELLEQIVGAIAVRYATPDV